MARKYEYYAVIQQNYGQGWEDVSKYATTSQGIHLEKHQGKPLLKHDLKEYRLTGCPARVVNRRTKIA